MKLIKMKAMILMIILMESVNSNEDEDSSTYDGEVDLPVEVDAHW